MASLANENEAVTAAKVIRILHNNHAAASEYLRSLYDGAEMSRIEFRLYLRHSPLEEYVDLLKPLETSHKAVLYEKASRMREKKTAYLDKDTTRIFFDLLELEKKGLRFKDVRREVKNQPAIDETLDSPAVPHGDSNTKNKRKRKEEVLAGSTPHPEPETPIQSERHPKKQKTKSAQSTLVSETPIGAAGNSTQHGTQSLQSTPAVPSASASKRERRKARRGSRKSSDLSGVHDSVKDTTQPQEDLIRAEGTPVLPTGVLTQPKEPSTQPKETSFQPVETVAQPEETPARSSRRKARRGRRIGKRKEASERQLGSEHVKSSPAPANISSPAPANNSSRAAANDSSPALANDLSSDRSNRSSPVPELPAMDIQLPESVTRTALPLTSKPTFVTVPSNLNRRISTSDKSSPRLEVNNVLPSEVRRSPSPEAEISTSPKGSSVPPESSSELDLRAGSIAFPAQPAAPRPSSSRPAFAPARTAIIPSASTAASSTDFRNFNAFLAGRKLDEDDTSSDDESSSSSSSGSDDDIHPDSLSSRVVETPALSQSTKTEAAASDTQVQPEYTQDEPSQMAGAEAIDQSMADGETQNEFRTEPFATEDALNEVPVADAEPSNDTLVANPVVEFEFNNAESPDGIPDPGAETGVPQEDIPHLLVEEDNSQQAEPITFTSFHHSSPWRARSPTPVPEFPVLSDLGDLMDHGAYRPAREDEYPGPHEVAEQTEAMGWGDSLDVDLVGSHHNQESEQENQETVIPPAETNDSDSSPTRISDHSTEDAGIDGVHLEDDIDLGYAVSNEDHLDDSQENEAADGGGVHLVNEDDGASVTNGAHLDDDEMRDDEAPETADVPVTEVSDHELPDADNSHPDIEKVSGETPEARENGPGDEDREEDQNSVVNCNDNDLPDAKQAHLHVREEDVAPDTYVTQISSSVFDFSNEVTEEQLELLEGFRGVFEKGEERSLDRLSNRRKQLGQGIEDTPEGHKNMLERMFEEVEREEVVYKAKLAAARRAVGKAEHPEMEARMYRIVGRAEEKFDIAMSITRENLEKEHHEQVVLSQQTVNRRGSRSEAQVVIEPLTDAYRAQFVDLSPESVKKEVTFDTEGGEDDENDDPEESDYEESSAKKRSPRKKRKSTGVKSKHFATPSPKKKRVPAGTSAVPFPKLSAPRFGLIQEELAGDPFRLLVAVTFLNKTAGRAAVPIFRQLMEQYPTPEDLAAADVSEISEMVHSLGLQNQRAKKLIRLATTWSETPPQKGIRYRTRDYPLFGHGRDLKPNQIVEEDSDDCAGALEIGHMYGLGPYAWDSWRIFCRDKLRGVADGYNGENVPGYSPNTDSSQTTFEPEWKRVVPLDKELRACLRWMWLREGWEWDPLTGKKKVAAIDLVREASAGAAAWEEPVPANPHGLSDGTPGSSAKARKIKEEVEGEPGPEALTPGTKVAASEQAVKSVESPLLPSSPPRRPRTRAQAKLFATDKPSLEAKDEAKVESDTDSSSSDFSGRKRQAKGKGKRSVVQALPSPEL